MVVAKSKINQTIINQIKITMQKLNSKKINKYNKKVLKT